MGNLEKVSMRKTLLAVLAVCLLSSCDNPEELHHPEIQRKVDPAVQSKSPATTSSATAGTTTVTSQPATVDPRRDQSPAKSADIPIDGTIEGLNVQASLEIDVTIGAETKVSVECNEKSFDAVQVSLKGTTLNIFTKQNFNATLAKVHVITPTLSAVTLGASSLCTVTGVTGPMFNATATMSSLLDASGKVDNLNITGSGSSLFRLKGLEATNVNVVTSDKCVAEVNSVDSVTAVANGESIINISGKPKSVTKQKAPKSYINMMK